MDSTVNNKPECLHQIMGPLLVCCVLSVLGAVAVLADSGTHLLHICRVSGDG